MEQSSLTFKVFKNSLYNIVGFLWPMIFTLLVTPIIIFSLGVKEYGIYIFVNAVISLLGLLDLGLGIAVTKHMSFYYGKNDMEGIKRLEQSANSLFLILGIVGYLLLVLIVFGGNHFLPDRFSAYHQYSILFLIAGGGLFFTTISATYNATLFALQRFDIINKIGLVSVTFSSLSMLLVVKLGGSLRAIFLSQLILIILISSTTFYVTKKIMPLISFKLGWNKNEIKHCYRFGIVNFINNIANGSLASLDRLIIPIFVGPTNLTYYSIPGNVTAKIPGMSNTLGISLFPTVSQLSGSENIPRIENLYVRSFRLITIVGGALTITSISFSYKILQFWLNNDFAKHSSGVLIVLALTNFILALFGPLSNFLLGLGKLKPLIYSSIGMALFNAGLLFILLPKYGIIGASWAYLISVLPVIYLFYYTETRYLNLPKRKKYYIRTILGTLITSLIIWTVNILLGYFIVSLITLLLIGGVSALLYFITYRLLGFFEKQDWKDLELFYLIILKKFKLKDEN